MKMLPNTGKDLSGGNLQSPQFVRSLSLRTNFAWTLVGNVVYALAQWGKLVAIAKFGTPELVGQFTLGLAYGAPIILFFNLGLRPIQATDAKRNYRFSDFLSLRLVTSVFAFVVVAMVAYITGRRDEILWVIAAVGLWKAVDAIGEVYYGLFQQVEKMDLISISMVAKSVLSLAGMVVGVYLWESVVWGTLLGVFLSSMVWIFYDGRNAEKILKELYPAAEAAGQLKLHADYMRLKNLTMVALPLGFAAMLISLNTNIPRYVLENYFGTRELGIYAAMAYLITVGNTVVNALGQSATPRMAKYYSGNYRGKFIKLLIQLIAIGAFLGIASVLAALIAGRQILTIIYKPEYAQNVEAFAYTMAAGGILYIASFLSYSILSVRSYKLQAAIFGIVSLTSYVACMALVPTYGIIGAAWATAISNFVQAVAFTIVLIYRLYINPVQENRGETS